MWRLICSPKGYHSFNMYRHFALRTVVWMMKATVVVNLNRINMARDKSIGQLSSLCVYVCVCVCVCGSINILNDH